MTTAAFVLAALALVVSLICLGALIELYGRIDDLRHDDRLRDTVKTLPDLTRTLMGRHPSDFGLEIPAHEAGRHYVLFLSPSCVTCESVAVAMRGKRPARTTIVLSTTNPAVFSTYLSRVGLNESDVHLDANNTIARALHLDVTPSLVGIIDGAIGFAASVPSFDALVRMTEEAYLPGDALNIRSEVMNDEPWRRQAHDVA